MSFRKLIGKLFKGTKEPEAQAMEAALTTLQEGAQPMPIKMRRRRLRRDKQFADPRMTRGVQMAMECKRRPARLAFIWESVRQANEVRRCPRHFGAVQSAIQVHVEQQQVINDTGARGSRTSSPDRSRAESPQTAKRTPH